MLSAIILSLVLSLTVSLTRKQDRDFRLNKCIENVQNESRAENITVTEKNALDYCKILENNPHYKGNVASN
jgi:hypothetical protein